MIGCARRAFPGMVFSLMLAAPGVVMASDGRVVEAPPRTAVTGMRKPAPVVRKQIARVAPKSMAGAALPLPGATGKTIGWAQTGMASWYGGDRWQGKHTASGALYDQNALTAAHATLPIGSRVKVMVDGTDHWVVVTINDRPGTKTRIIDLSRAAAKELGILTRGVARVRIVRVDA